MLLWLPEPNLFQSYYRKTADQLAERLAVNLHVNYRRVLRAHFAWLAHIGPQLESGELSEERPDFLPLVLGQLGLRVCREGCVRITRNASRPVEERYAGHQALLLEFPDVYSALDMVRGIHMDSYYYDHGAAFFRDHLDAMPPDELHKVLEAIYKNPALFNDYSALLQLPTT